MIHGRTFVLQTNPCSFFSIYCSKKKKKKNDVAKHTVNQLQRWETLMFMI